MRVPRSAVRVIGSIDDADAASLELPVIDVAHGQIRAGLWPVRRLPE
jgi:hypothetical protein